MAAYLVFIKEREHDAKVLEDYTKKAIESLAGQPAKPLVMYGESKTLEGPEAQGAVIIEFPTLAEASAWYHSDAYQKARAMRFQGGDYRVLMLEGAKAPG